MHFQVREPIKQLCAVGALGFLARIYAARLVLEAYNVGEAVFVVNHTFLRINARYALRRI